MFASHRLEHSCACWNQPEIGAQPVLHITAQRAVQSRMGCAPGGQGGLKKRPALLGWREGDRLDVVFLLKQFDSMPHEAAGYPETLANDAVLEILAGVPYSRFPVTAQALIDNVRIARPKVRLWLAARGLETPDGLVVDGDTDAPETGVPEGDVVRAPQTQSDNTPVRGRPSKKAWVMIVEHAKKLHSNDPSRLKKCVANDVHEIALNAFGPDEVPAPATIQRRMKDILGGSS